MASNPLTKLVVGLGNPGPEYAETRHNVGFLALDHLCREKFSGQRWKKQFQGELIEVSPGLYFLKPLTYMNNSGRSVRECCQFFKIELQNVLVLHDEIDQAFGDLKVQFNRGHGGHNGIRDITAQMGSMAYGRFRIGVGRPTHQNFPVADYVLSRFSSEEQGELSDLLACVGRGVQHWVQHGLEKTANAFNKNFREVS